MPGQGPGLFRQTHLIASGAQNWISQPLLAHGKQFAYASTLAVYIYNNEDQQLQKITGYQSHTITAFAWNPRDSNIIAVATNDDHINIFDVAKDESVKKLKMPKRDVVQLEWDPNSPQIIRCVAENTICKLNLDKNMLEQIRFSPPGGHRITRMVRNARLSSMCAIGTDKGHVYLYNTDNGVHETVVTNYKEPIVDLDFDPKSEDYMLIACASGQISMWCVQGAFNMDPKKKEIKPMVITEFSRQPAGLCACKFMPNMPGTFVTASDRHGVLRTWSVSNANPMNMIKLEQGKVHSLAPLQGVESGSKLSVSFKTGEVSIVDVRTRRTRWVTTGGHTETVFDCVIAPSDPNKLISASFDGTVRCWDMRTKEQTACFFTGDAPSGRLGSDNEAHQAGRGALYTCAISCDGSTIAAAGFEGIVYFFDVESGKALKAHRVHSGAVHRIVAHPLEHGVFATAGVDARCCVVTRDGLRKALNHTMPIQGCSWDPFQPDIIACGGKDGTIEIWNVTNEDHQSIDKICDKHTTKVYGVLYSPLVQGRLMSVSDDKTAKIFELTPDGRYTARRPVTLEGHESNVRGQAWHPEIPEICFTGSWDKTVRTWNSVTGQCLQVTKRHLADVYAIATHPARPFIAVTCSRDSTIRFWSTEECAPAAKIRAVLGKDATSCSIVGEERNGDEHKRLLGRAAGRDLGEKMAASSSDGERFGAAFAALSGEPLAEELWHLATIESTGVKDARGFGATGISVPHRSEVESLVSDRAARLEEARFAKTRGGDKKDVALRKAATLRLELGDFRAYCELMKEIGEWDAALSIAPAVSLEYWRRLAGERIKSMEKDEDADVERLVHLQLAAGKVSDATSGLVRAGRDEEAFTVACTAAEGRFGPEIAEDAGGTPSPSPLKKLAPLGGGGGSPPKPAGPLSPPPAPGHHARVPSDGSGAGGPLDTLPHNLDGSLPAALKARNSLPSLGGGVGKLAPLPPIAGAGTLNKLRAVSAFGSLQTNGNGHAVTAHGDGGALPPTPAGAQGVVAAAKKFIAKGGVDEASTVRGAQAAARLLHGDVIGAASRYLSVGNTREAVRALIRGSQVEMATALMRTLPDSSPGSKDAAHVLACERAVELGEWEIAAEAAGSIHNVTERSWRLLLVRARFAATESDPSIVERFDRMCDATRDVAGAWEAGCGGDAAESAVLHALVGEVDRAASETVHAVNDELGRNGQWNAKALTRLLEALHVVSHGANALKPVDPVIRAEVTLQRCYLSALVLSSAGYTPAANALFHHARAALKQLNKGEARFGFPHAVAMISIHELSLMMGHHPTEAEEGLAEVAEAASVPVPLREIAARLHANLTATSDIPREEPALPAMESIVPPVGYNGAMDWKAPKMTMVDALRTAKMWDAAGAMDHAFFRTPQ
mmetsp:Transcript_7752/g.31406  ORF Transcript_7752/g.31406 Transcript_7752/m.31406 type:complete len:1403 (+) Transcript_7752:154-4362(+)